MAKRSVSKSENYSTELEIEDQVNLEEDENPSEVWLVLMVDSIVKTKGPVTGNMYVFSGAGSRVLVDYEDAMIMIEKRRRSCCGTAAQTRFFELGD